MAGNRSPCYSFFPLWRKEREHRSVLHWASATNGRHANYPQIRQYGLIEQTERYNLSNAAKGWMPQLSVNAKATYQSDVTKLPFDADKLSAIIPGIEIPTLSKDQYQVVAEVNQTIWDGGVIRSTRQLTEAQATADREQLNSDLYTLNDR